MNTIHLGNLILSVYVHDVCAGLSLVHWKPQMPKHQRKHYNKFPLHFLYGTFIFANNLKLCGGGNDMVLDLGFVEGKEEEKIGKENEVAYKFSFLVGFENI